MISSSPASSGGPGPDGRDPSRPVPVDEPLDLADLLLLVVMRGPLALDLPLLLVQVALEVPR